MKNREIYKGALRILAETSVQGSNEDYEERAPYIIAAFYSECADIDKSYRRANDLPDAVPVNEVFVSLDDNFPCAARFASAACVYVAAMLIIDENTELSDKLYDKYSDMMSTICSGIPSYVEKISNRYP